MSDNNIIKIKETKGDGVILLDLSQRKKTYPKVGDVLAINRKYYLKNVEFDYKAFDDRFFYGVKPSAKSHLNIDDLDLMGSVVEIYEEDKKTYFKILATKVWFERPIDYDDYDDDFDILEKPTYKEIQELENSQNEVVFAYIHIRDTDTEYYSVVEPRFIFTNETVVEFNNYIHFTSLIQQSIDLSYLDGFKLIFKKSEGADPYDYFKNFNASPEAILENFDFNFDIEEYNKMGLEQHQEHKIEKGDKIESSIMKNETNIYNSNYHCMLDIETLGEDDNSLISQISLVRFNPMTNERFESITVNIDIDDSIKKGFKIDSSTLQWWMSQPRFKEVMYDGERLKVKKALHKIQDFIHKNFSYNDLYIYGKSPRFDLAKLKNYYVKVLGLKTSTLPWDFRKEIDVRTIITMNPELYKQSTVSQPHDSLGDCYNQIDGVHAVIKNIFK